MKKEVPLNKANRLINSGQVILVTSGDQQKANIITLAWNTPLSHTPPLLGISVAKKHLSAEFIQQQKEFVVNVPDISLLEKVVYCGSFSGREVDKFKEAGLTKATALKVNVPLIDECIGHVECVLKDTVDAGDHFFFIGEPVFASAKEDIFDGVWQVDMVKLIYHLGGVEFTTSSNVLTI